MDELSSPEQRTLSRSIALKAIADEAQKKKDEGQGELAVMTFIRGARRELANQEPDIGKHVQAVKAVQDYKSANPKTIGTRGDSVEDYENLIQQQ